MNETKFLSDAERLTLEDSLRARLDTDLRNPLAFLVALHSGARASELIGLEWTDIDTTTGAVFIRTLKGGAPRVAVLPTFLRGPLERLKAAEPRKPFDLSYNRLGELWRLYRTVKKPLHSLRHTFAMRAYDRTKDIRFVQKALGHKSITNTMVYADCSYSAAQFKKLMRVR